MQNLQTIAQQINEDTFTVSGGPTTIRQSLNIGNSNHTNTLGKTRTKMMEEVNSYQDQEMMEQDSIYDEENNNETVRELRENRYRQYQRKLMALKYDI